MSSPFKIGILQDVQILVVDNDVDSGVVYSVFLEHFGANVITTSFIKEALKILTWFIPDILICEIRFLGESVYTLLNRLTAMEVWNKNHIPTIVISTCAKGTVDQITEIGFEGYLLKPIDLDQLVAVIENQVQPGRYHSLADKSKYLLINDMEVEDSFFTVSNLGRIKLFEVT